jgi:tRNA/tmRNA/rRNA uracil-C5-methylase (TrmA/RlmC/RlmD family)
VFDICCGTGAIGICLSSKAKKVIGIELLESAVENAK